MRTTVPCPSNLALEQYLLGELSPSQSHVGDHVATCEICHAKLADKAADSAVFASSPGAVEIKTALSSPAFALPRAPMPASTPLVGARDVQRRRIVAALGFAAVIALAFVLTLRPPASVTSASRAGDVDEKEAVMRVQREWMEAIRDKNAAALDRILGDDYTYTDSRGAVTNKADSLREARTSRGRMTAYHTSDEKVHICGDLAIVTGRLRVEGVAGGGQAYDAEVRFTDILARIDGQWRAVAAHASRPSER